MMEVSSAPVRSASLGTTRVGITSTSVGGDSLSCVGVRLRTRLTTRDYGLEIDDSIRKGCPIEYLSGNFDGGEQQWCRHCSSQRLLV